ncbi:MAG TPA: ABC transporter permease [Acidimicrobiales bacterium]
MTTTAVTLDRPEDHYRLSGSLRSEWTKLRTVRSTVWTLAALVAASIGVGIIASAETASHWATMSAADKVGYDPTNLSLTGLALGQIAIGVLGVLIITAEYSTGTIRATLAAVPNRPLVLASKAAVFGGVALVVGEVVSFIAFLTGQSLLSGQAPHASLGQPGVLQAVVLAGVYVAGIGLVAMGLGAIIRHTAGAISALVGLVFIVPLVLQAFPTSIKNSVSRYFPSDVGSAMASVHRQAHSLSPGVALAVLCIYVVVALALGGWLLVRRDA